MPPPRGDRLDSERAHPEPPSLETVVGDLEAKVVVLTAVQEGLLTRLARLEAKLASGAFVAAAPDAERRAQLRPAPGEPLEEAESVSAPDAESESDPLDESASADAAPSSLGGPLDPAPADEASASNLDAPAAQPGGEPDAPPGAPPRLQLALPPVSELAKCVVLLIGGDFTVKEGDPPFPVNRTTKDCYAASVLDDHDQTIGVIVMDLKAAVFLGGTLMMLPRAEIEQQLKSLSPGEDSIAASAEICNALSGAINGSQDQHVRIGRLEKFEFRTWSWVTSAADRRDLEDSFGGRTVLFSRPPPGQIS